MYCSYVLKVPLYTYYPAFKFVRRRFRLLAKEKITPKTAARVWKSARQTWLRWITDIAEHQGRFATHHAPHSYTLITDASTIGFGGIAFGSDSYLVRTICGRWDDFLDTKTLSHINELEAWAMSHSANNLIPHQSTIDIYVDNSSVVAATSNTKSRNFRMNQDIGFLLRNFKVRSIEYIPSTLNPADRLSRGNKYLSPEDWQLLVEVQQGHGESGARQPKELSTSLIPYSPVTHDKI
jgi:hypothetical protein